MGGVRTSEGMGSGQTAAGEAALQGALASLREAIVASSSSNGMSHVLLGQLQLVCDSFAARCAGPVFEVKVLQVTAATQSLETDL
jgi:hypothetical protein